MIIQETLSEKKAVILQLFIKIRKKNKKKMYFLKLNMLIDFR